MPLLQSGGRPADSIVGRAPWSGSHSWLQPRCWSSIQLEGGRGQDCRLPLAWGAAFSASWKTKMGGLSQSTLSMKPQDLAPETGTAGQVQWFSSKCRPRGGLDSAPLPGGLRASVLGGLVTLFPGDLRWNRSNRPKKVDMDWGPTCFSGVSWTLWQFTPQGRKEGSKGEGRKGEGIKG